MLTTTNFDQMATVSIEERVKEKYKEQFSKMEEEILKEWQDLEDSMGLKKKLLEVRITPKIEVITGEVPNE